MQGKPTRRNNYKSLLIEIKSNILRSRYLAARTANRELVLLYFRIGQILTAKISEEEWGSKLLQKISNDIQQAFPGIRGFSERNLEIIKQFYQEYSFLEIPQSLNAEMETKDNDHPLSLSGSGLFQNKQSVPDKISICKNNDNHNEFSEVFWGIGFTHHVILIRKCSDLQQRMFYMKEAVKRQWSTRVLEHQIEAQFYERRGKLQSNFQETVPSEIRDHAMEAFKDEYLLNFINTAEDRSEPGMEKEILSKLRKFMMSLGNEFAFLGNQYRLLVGGDEFFIDLLFYHRILRCLIAFELKTGKFKPEYTGKMNFYLSALDELVKHPEENPSIGIILCKKKNNTVVEFAFKDITKPIGIAIYRRGKELPEQYRKYLPKPEDFDEMFNGK